MWVKRSELVESVQIVADADRLTSRVGTALLVGLADRVGLSGALSQAMGGVRKRRSRHDPGRTLRNLAVMVADGGDCLADLSALRDQPSLFGEVCSDATAWRALAALDGERLAAVRRARAQARGLMFRRHLAPNAGMLFDFHHSRPVTFWMKDTILPLDMIFIRADGTIRAIHANAAPYSETPIPSAGPVRAVLEINGGRAAALDIVPGERVQHAIFGNLRAPRRHGR